MLQRFFLLALGFGALVLGPCGPAPADDRRVTVFARLSATPGREEEAKSFVLKLHRFIVDNKKTPLVYTFYQSTQDPTQFFAYEVYESREAYDAHMKNNFAAAMKAIGEPPKGLFTRPIESDVVSQISP